MKFKRLIALVLCFTVILNAALFHAAAHGRHQFQEVRVRDLMGGGVPVKVERAMFKGCSFVAEGWMLTELQWVGFLVQNLLVGRNAYKIREVVLRRPSPGEILRMPAESLPGGDRFYAGVSRSGNKLTIVCPSVSSTFCDKWYLNEMGLTLFGR